jgi:hypothetical protein
MTKTLLAASVFALLLPTSVWATDPGQNAQLRHSQPAREVERRERHRDRTLVRPRPQAQTKPEAPPRALLATVGVLSTLLPASKLPISDPRTKEVVEQMTRAAFRDCLKQQPRTWRERTTCENGARDKTWGRLIFDRTLFDLEKVSLLQLADALDRKEITLAEAQLKLAQIRAQLLAEAKRPPLLDQKNLPRPPYGWVWPVL